MKFIAIFINFLCFGLVFGQNTNLKIGDWTTHYPYKTGNCVTQSNEKVYFSNQFSIFSIDKSDNSIEYLTKGKELSGTDIKSIKYNIPNKVLVVNYQSTKIELVFDNHTVSFNNIEINNGIVGEKIINNIHFEKDTFMYLSCGFGLIQFNLKKLEFGFTTFTDNLKVFCSQVFGDYIYVGTDVGIYRALRYGSNLSDFKNWQLFSTFQFKCKDMITFNNQLIFLTDYGVNRYDNVNIIYDVYSDSDQTIFLSEGKDKFYSSSYFILSSIDKSWSGVKINNNCITKPTYAVEDEEGQLWISDAQSGFYKITKDGSCIPILINSPSLAGATDIVIQNKNIWLVSGGLEENGTPLSDGNGYNYRSADGNWTVKDFSNDSYLKSNNILDLNEVAPHPTNGKTYFAAYSNGLLELDSSKTHYKLYDNSNSSLQLTEGDVRVRNSSIAFDKDNNLWLLNFNAPNPISLFTKDEKWYSFSNSYNRSLFSFIIDKYGYKWIATNNGVLIYDSGKDIVSPIDDRYKYVTTVPTQKLTSINKVNAIEKDKDGDIWVATVDGVVVFECGNNPFDNNCKGTRRIVVNGGFAEYLLTDVEVKCIAVDGANRKWFGTNSGLFLQSQSGEEQLLHYTIDNSPLPDNTITALTIDNDLGEIYVMTNKGMVSFRIEAIDGKNINSSNVYAFPNPVRPEYNGPIAVKGVASDANVKITDIEGKLVFEGKALGGQAIWNGLDLSGRKVSSGVYLVYCTGTNDLENPDAVVTKIVFIAR